ncbi:MAG: rod shape-determining protein MreC [Pseudomonadota bacterium]
MRVLKADPYARSGRPEGAGGAPASGGVLLFALMFLSLSLIVLSRLNHTTVQGLRAQLVEAMLPTLEVVSAPAIRVQQARRKIGAYMKVLSEIDRLEAQNEELRRWEARARELEREIERYRALVNAKDTRNFSFVTGRVVADGRGPFARSVILNIGADAGVTNGRPVVNGDGLVGRTLNVGASAARVLLLTDPNSRVPVVFGTQNDRGVLVGTNTAKLEISFALQAARPKIGDDVRTSGHGGLFPPGLSVGRVTALTPRITVAPHADDDRIDFVSVLLFERPEAGAFTTTGDPVLAAARRRARADGKDSGMPLPVRPSRVVKKDAGARRTVRRRRP